MYVRLAFAVVVHVNPDILIVDEALAVGDALFQAKCMTRMRRMLDDGLTLLFISHDIAAVKALCQRALWLDHGRVRALGATPEVTRDYDHDWIRQANAAHDLPTDAPAAAAASDAEALLPSGVGTGAVALLAVGWGVAGMFGTEARAQHGDGPPAGAERGPVRSGVDPVGQPRDDRDPVAHEPAGEMLGDAPPVVARLPRTDDGDALGVGRREAPAQRIGQQP